VIEFEVTGAIREAVNAERESAEHLEDLEAQVELAAADDNPEAYQKAVDELSKGQRACFEGLSTLRLETARAKIPFIIEHLEEAIEESNKVVAFCHHKELVRAIADKFGEQAVQLVGDTSMEDRQAAVDRFQKDSGCKLFIGSIMAAGVGITLTAASHVVMCELDWVPGNVSQAEDRCHRIGQTDSVLVQHLVLEGSLDATIARRIIAKQEVIEKALDTIKTAHSADPEPIKASKAHPSVLLAEMAEMMTPVQRQAAQEAIRWLSNQCNGARDWDGAGFSKIDTAIGKELAARPFLSAKQCALARKIALRYAKTQLPPALAARL
jgi:SNF2 family DNA or RNA helicase